MQHGAKSNPRGNSIRAGLYYQQLLDTHLMGSAGVRSTKIVLNLKLTPRDSPRPKKISGTHGVDRIRVSCAYINFNIFKKYEFL